MSAEAPVDESDEKNVRNAPVPLARQLDFPSSLKSPAPTVRTFSDVLSASPNLKALHDTYSPAGKAHVKGLARFFEDEGLHFRTAQLEAITAACHYCQNVLFVDKCGSGKGTIAKFLVAGPKCDLRGSSCVVVVTVTVSLNRSFYYDCIKHGFLRVGELRGGVNKHRVLSDFKSGKFNVLAMTPEMLANRETVDAMVALRIHS